MSTISYSPGTSEVGNNIIQVTTSIHDNGETIAPYNYSLRILIYSNSRSQFQLIYHNIVY